ncbi:hypothetical protein EDB85DRAFT_1251104 [Lactarius pseudohatsudake]|nr:hypothetical protein EDB85DRAFT_1251104 [Lactarius pseudohatsudake]
MHHVPRRTAPPRGAGGTWPRTSRIGLHLAPVTNLAARCVRAISSRNLTTPKVYRPIPHVPKRCSPAVDYRQGIPVVHRYVETHTHFTADSGRSVTTFTVSVLWPHAARHTSSDSPRARLKTKTKTKTKERTNTTGVLNHSRLWVRQSSSSSLFFLG